MKFNRFKRFNTYRSYTPEGQNIFCLLKDGKVWFIDQARNIRGVLESGTGSKGDIMREYDAGHYKELDDSTEEIQEINNQYGVWL